MTAWLHRLLALLSLLPFLFGIAWADSFSETLSLEVSLSDKNGSNWNEAVAADYGNALSDALSASDSVSAGYGNAISDTQSLSDSLLAGYGLASGETLTLTDQGAAGYGNAVSDAMALSAAATRLDIAVIVSDGLNAWSDALAVGHGFVIAESLARL